MQAKRKKLKILRDVPHYRVTQLDSNVPHNLKRILVTIDTDFGQLVYVNGARHCGIVRLPDVSAHERIHLMEMVLTRYSSQLEQGAIITVRGERIRVSKPIQ